MNPYSSPTVSDPKPRSEREKSNNGFVEEVATAVVLVGKRDRVVAIIYIIYIYIYICTHQ